MFFVKKHASGQGRVFNSEIKQNFFGGTVRGKLPWRRTGGVVGGGEEARARGNWLSSVTTKGGGVREMSLLGGQKGGGQINEKASEKEGFLSYI